MLNFRFLSRVQARCINGISARQGGHQVAQKLIITTSPRRSARSTVLPLMSLSLNSGAGGRVGSGRKSAIACRGFPDSPMMKATRTRSQVIPEYRINIERQYTPTKLLGDTSNKQGVTPKIPSRMNSYQNPWLLIPESAKDVSTDGYLIIIML